MNLAKVQAVISRRFDRLNIHGIGFNDFMILYLLLQSAAGKMRRIDLADQIGKCIRWERSNKKTVGTWATKSC
ncbi:hypothetical protein SAMN05421820_104155 [Pedobacter steynii]|uniref:Uncharacterized protein n=1 Tax=Pedobacter steynii TaxID=430522 RepID=A0A1G9UF56_9SPHI|nr:hypothetical protein [Pedobacter steynii]NQX40750.1 hypothetical protein [Pedobacter steynii]SDM58546.1 hypothetical protein SAMN05421820_104155 [Pedobacter steynii]